MLTPFTSFLLSFTSTVTAIITTRQLVVGLVLQEDAGLIVSATDDGRLHCNSTANDLRDVSVKTKATLDAGAGVGMGMDVVPHEDMDKETNLVTFLDR